jgi:hypothetical protein
MSDEIAIFQNAEVIQEPPSLVALEKVLSGLPQLDVQFNHHFSDHIYVRERFAKADTLIVGKRHRYATCSILLQGELSVYDGEKVKRYTAPHIFNSIAGAKRMTYSHTDTILVTIHPTTSTDLDEIEKTFIIPEEEFESGIIEGRTLAELGGVS